MRYGLQTPETSVRGWSASPVQLAAAQAALKAQQEGKDEKEVLLAARGAAEGVAVNEAAQAVTRRYLLALTNRANMQGRYAELSTIELLDITLSTAPDGGLAQFEEYRRQLQLVEEATK